MLWAFRNLPVESKHPQAFKAAKLAECARRQGQFLQVATALFERQRSLGDDLFVQLSHEFGLNEARLKECVSGEAEARVRADVALGRDLGITGTPTFLVGLLRSDGRVGVTAVLKGGLALPGFRQVLDDALKPKWYSGWAGLALAAGLVLISAAAMVGVSRKRR